MAEAAIDRAEPAALERGSLRSLLAIGGGPVPGRADVAILGYVGALLVLWSPAFYLGLLTPRIAIVLVGLGPGLAVVFGLARRGDRASWWLLGWLAWAALAALASSSPRLSLLGVYGIDSGWIYLAGYVGAWGLGRRLRPSSRPLLGRIVFAGLAVNMAFAVLEVVIDPSGDLATNAGRAAGLQTNSLYLAGLLTGLLAMLARSVGRGAPRWRLALVVPTALALNLTGSRTALVGGTVIAVAAVALPGSGTALDRPERLLRTLAVVVGVGLGVLISLPLQGEASTVVRLEGNEASGGMRNRVLMWEAGVEALDERPLVGWGPGRFREATSSRITAEFARLEGPEKVFFDAHNVVVEQLVTTGVVGAALLGGFVVLAVLRARGPFAWFAAGIALTWLTNPVSVCGAPVALVLLGAAWTRGPTPIATSSGPVPLGRRVGAGLCAIGVVAGLVVLVADASIDTGVANVDPAPIDRARALLLDDPTVTGLLAEVRGAVATEDPTAANRKAAIDAAQAAADGDPSRSSWWNQLAEFELLHGEGTEEQRLARAEAAFEEALERNPWSARALVGLSAIASQRGDAVAQARWDAKVCQVIACAGE